MLELLSFVLSQPFCMPVLIMILNAWLIPWEYLGLCNAGIIAIWSVFLFPWNRPYVDANFDFMADIVLFYLNFMLLMGILALITVRLSDKSARKILVNELRKFRNKLRKEQKNRSRKDKVLKTLSFSAYGILAAYFSYLLLADFWHDYRPAWQAYTTILAISIGAIFFCFLIDRDIIKYRFFYKLKYLSLFFYSFAISIIIILFANLSFSIIARQETKKVIQEIGDLQTKYCIQSNRKPINSWLHLTPMTAWNKSNGNLGAGIRHAVLVIEKHNQYILYHWSYKLRKWEFTSVEFEPGAFIITDSLECTPEFDYLNKLPFWSA